MRQKELFPGWRGLPAWTAEGRRWLAIRGLGDALHSFVGVDVAGEGSETAVVVRQGGEVVDARVLAFAGWVYEDGSVLCAACVGRGEHLLQRGYRSQVYSGTDKDAELGACERCFADVRGEDPRQ